MVYIDGLRKRIGVEAWLCEAQADRFFFFERMESSKVEWKI